LREKGVMRKMPRKRKGGVKGPGGDSSGKNRIVMQKGKKRKAYLYCKGESEHLKICNASKGESAILTTEKKEKSAETQERGRKRTTRDHYQDESSRAIYRETLRGRRDEGSKRGALARPPAPYSRCIKGDPSAIRKEHGGSFRREKRREVLSYLGKETRKRKSRRKVGEDERNLEHYKNAFA